MGVGLLVALVVDLIIFGIHLVEVGALMLTKIVDVFFENDIPAIVSSGEDFGQLGL